MPDLINGAILENARKKIADASRVTDLPDHIKPMYEVADLIVLFMQGDHPKTQEMYSAYENNKEDHARTTDMYTAYKFWRWVWLVGGTAILGAFATGKVTIMFVK